jgi:hypothetical protein
LFSVTRYYDLLNHWDGWITGLKKNMPTGAEETGGNKNGCV